MILGVLAIILLVSGLIYYAFVIGMFFDGCYRSKNELINDIIPFGRVLRKAINEWRSLK